MVCNRNGKGDVYSSINENSCTEDATREPGIAKPASKNKIKTEAKKVLL
jgi:hypothetical protein